MFVPGTLGVYRCWIIDFEENLVHIILVLPMVQIVSLPTWIVSASANLFLVSTITTGFYLLCRNYDI
jgi:hypothetical protein